MGELLPCPLCGNPNVDTDEGVFPFPGNGHTLPCWGIQCGKPGCISIEARTRKEVVEMWNTRTPASADAAAGDAIDAARYRNIRNSDDYQVCRFMGGTWVVFTGSALDKWADIIDDEEIATKGDVLLVPYTKAMECLQVAYTEGTRGVGYNEAANKLYDYAALAQPAEQVKS